jgi:hypothetical protein
MTVRPALNVNLPTNLSGAVRYYRNAVETG